MMAPGVEALLGRAVRAMGGLPGGGTAWATVGAVAVSPALFPMHRAVASDCVRVLRTGASAVFVKLRRADMGADVVPWAADAARKAAALGLAS